MKVKHIVAKWVQGGRAVYFIQWQNYSQVKVHENQLSTCPKNSSLPSRTDLSIHFVLMNAERLALLFAMGLKSPLAWNETIMMWHNVVRVLFPGLLSDLHGPLYLAIEELIAAGLSPYLKKCLTVTGNGCCIDPLVNLKLLLGNLLSFIDEQGHKTAPCPVEKVQINFMKSHFAECI